MSDDETEDNTEPTHSKHAERIVDKRGPSSSVVWRYFGYLESDKKQSGVHCKLCRQHVPTKTGNTTNLFHHLKQYHPLEYAEGKKLQSQTSASGPSTSTGPVSVKPKQQQTLITAFSSTVPYDKKNEKTQRHYKCSCVFHRKRHATY